MTAFAAWVLSLMVVLEPHAPWRDTYDVTANAIADAVTEEQPLFRGEHGREKTAALLVSLAWFESRFDTRAIGDHGQAHGLYQQHDRGELSDASEATHVALEQIRASQKICAGRDVTEMLGWYAAGGRDCARGLVKSKHRVLKAQWLLRAHPFVDDDAT